MYDSIQAVLTSQLRYRALWNESTAAKTVMSYIPESYRTKATHGDRCDGSVTEAVEPGSRSRRDNSRFDRPPRAVVTAISCTMERKHSYENGDVIPESYRTKTVIGVAEWPWPRGRDRAETTRAEITLGERTRYIAISAGGKGPHSNKHLGGKNRSFFPPSSSSLACTVILHRTHRSGARWRRRAQMASPK